jgi:hypothetical protein
MNKIYKKSLHVNNSSVQAGDKEISQRKYKNLSFRFLLIAALVSVAMSSFFIACNSDNPLSDNTEFETYLSLRKPGFDFANGNWESLSESDKITFKLAQKRMDFTFDADGICTTKWTSNHQVNMSEELFNCFIDMIDFSNEVTKQLSEIQGIKTPRLKSGNEACNPSDYSSRINNCVVRSLKYVTSYSYTTIDNWICANGYYVYSSTYGWGVVVSPVLTHFSGVQWAATSSNLASATSGNCILILSGTINHAVVFTGYNSSTVSYYDPQAGTNGSCGISGILAIYKF